MKAEPLPGPQDTGLHCLALIMRLVGVAGDVAQMRHQFAPPGQVMGDTDLMRCAKAYHFKVRLVRTSWERIAKTPLPAIAKHQQGHYVVLAGIREGRVLIQDPLHHRPLELSREAFEAHWTGELLLLAHRSQWVGERRRFDITWFIPPIVKYRRILGEVLLGSFFLQLFALVTPLFFQVIIDKVLVHRGVSTLHVLTVGLIVITLCETMMGGLRTYIFSHTTNRIDVELGASLFRHLMDLPLAYFGARRVGDTVARVRELENIRQFITGTSITVVVDLVFTFVFISVMFFYSTSLSWLVLAAIPFYVVLSVLVTPILRGHLEVKFQRGAENQAFLVETIAGMETIKSLAVEPQMRRHWETQLAAYVQSAFRASHLTNLAGQSAQFLSKVNSALILWFGAFQVMNNTLSVGELVAFNMLAGRVSAPIFRTPDPAIFPYLKQIPVSA